MSKDNIFSLKYKKTKKSIEISRKKKIFEVKFYDDTMLVSTIVFRINKEKHYNYDFYFEYMMQFLQKDFISNWFKDEIYFFIYYLFSLHTKIRNDDYLKLESYSYEFCTFKNDIYYIDNEPVGNEIRIGHTDGDYEKLLINKDKRVKENFYFGFGIIIKQIGNFKNCILISEYEKSQLLANLYYDKLIDIIIPDEVKKKIETMQAKIILMKKKSLLLLYVDEKYEVFDFKFNIL